MFDHVDEVRTRVFFLRAPDIRNFQMAGYTSTFIVYKLPTVAEIRYKYKHWKTASIVSALHDLQFHAQFGNGAGLAYARRTMSMQSVLRQCSNATVATRGPRPHGAPPLRYNANHIH